MSARKLDGRAEADRILKTLQRLVRKYHQPITLATILVGRRFDSALYVKLKTRAANQVGIKTEPHHLGENITQTGLHRVIKKLNRRRNIVGILLQLPLPRKLNADYAIALMDPVKDVDGFHPANTLITPPPVAAVLRLINMGKPKKKSQVIILGKASVFSQQLAEILERRGHNVVISTVNKSIPIAAKQADIVVTALGRGPLLRSGHIKTGAIVIDMGTRRKGQKVIGDVHSSVWQKAKAVSPVPGGVGPLTVAYVLYNTYILASHS